MFAFLLLHRGLIRVPPFRLQTASEMFKCHHNSRNSHAIVVKVTSSQNSWVSGLMECCCHASRSAVTLTFLLCPMQRQLAAAGQLQQHEAMQFLAGFLPSLQHEQQVICRLLGRLCNFDPKQRMTLQELRRDGDLLSLSRL